MRFPDGSTGELEMLRHPAPPPWCRSSTIRGDPDPRVLLIRQFRHAADGYIWEVPAGRLDPGEAPEACARRELEEETGMRARALERLTTIYTTPGFTDERIHLFLAHGLERGRPAPGGGRVHGAAHAAAGREVLELVRIGADPGREDLNSLMFVQCF